MQEQAKPPWLPRHRWLEVAAKPAWAWRRSRPPLGEAKAYRLEKASLQMRQTMATATQSLTVLAALRLLCGDYQLLLVAAPAKMAAPQMGRGRWTG